MRSEGREYKKIRVMWRAGIGPRVRLRLGAKIIIKIIIRIIINVFSNSITQRDG